MSDVRIATPGARRLPGNIMISENPDLYKENGVPRPRLVVKDNIDVAGYITTCGSSGYVNSPAVNDATVVKKLVEAGATVIGKANLDEFAWGLTGTNPHWGTIVNPVNPALTPGGSSGGTAAAIAAGYADIGLGTDTAGSLRVPAACCDLVSLRPRVGVLPLNGIKELAPSFDVVGPMARTITDLSWVWSVLSGGQVSAPALGQPRVQLLRVEEWGPPRMPASWEVLSSVDIDRSILDLFWVVMHAEAYATHQTAMESGASGFGDAIKRKLAIAAKVNGAQADSARNELARIRQKFVEEMGSVDAIIAPTLGRSIPQVGEDEALIRAKLGWPSALFSALDLAVVCVAGTQIVAKDESTALVLAAEFESALETGKDEEVS